MVDIQKGSETVIQDRTIYEDANIFAPNLHEMGLMSKRDFDNYFNFFQTLKGLVQPPDLLIYLHTPVSRLQKNIRKRNRAYEQNIPDEYLFNIQQTYTHYIKEHNIKTLFIDASNADFLGNEKHLQVVIEALEKDYDNGQHYLTLP